MGKAVGHDGISNRILRELASELFTLLASLFNESVHQGEVSISLKIAHVCPVPRCGGNASDICNYRPISSLSNLDKVSIRLVFKHLFNHLRNSNILTSFQFGFIPGVLLTLSISCIIHFARHLMLAKKFGLLW